MFAEQSKEFDPFAQAMAELSRLRQFAGPAAQFWPAFMRSTAVLCRAQQAVLALKKIPPGEAWQKLVQWSPGGPEDFVAKTFSQQLLSITERCSQEGSLVQGLNVPGTGPAKPYALAIRLELPKTQDACVAAYLLVAVTELQAQEMLMRVQLVADTPISYQLNQLSQQAQSDVAKFASTLDLMVQVNAEKRFMSAALAFCNGLATRHQCDRVSLGWHEQGFIRLQAISRTERFERNMSAVKTLEMAMEEALDQDEEIVWPPPEGSSQVTRDHEAYSREQGAKFLGSVPLRLEGEVVGAITCERHTESFGEADLKQLRMSCDQAVRRLADLKRSDRWFGARLMVSAREQIGQLIGVERTWQKVLGIVVAVAVLLVLVLRLNYRVEAKFVLHSDEVAFITAPFDGFISSVPVRVGEPVKKSQTLLSLDQDELKLEEAAATADLGRYSREAEKSRAARSLADMRISEALAEQARARLDLVQYRLQQSVLRSPFDGAVVEGEQRERLGAPVKQAEVLFRIARNEPLYVEAEVNEKDIHEVKLDAPGEIAFASQPKLKFPIRVVRIQPAAQPKEAENIFLVRCAFTTAPKTWWRPGMTGITKIEAGRRSLLWILTHRTVDYLRMLLWW
ncbi:MAG: efflux RND transporter periplasmic adaptor subunit [Candidatus Omnitrophica bacterium]|nr:efflux RND transporter periplasmic adaptor subunit [Candidatus Omnitrophota bacterium]